MWRFENTGHQNGEFNMRYDELLTQRFIEGNGIATLRVYGWKPPAISLGFHQKLESVDVDAAKDAGIDVVWRPTGGRAILHADEITYSVVMTTTESISAVYNRISGALVRALHLLGVDASLESQQADFASLYRQPSSVMCFASSARHEVKVNGRKLVGSAQRRYMRPDGADVVLQHGSILMGPEHLRIVEFLAGVSDAERDRMKDLLRQKTIDLGEIIDRRVSFEEAAAALRKGFETEWDIKFINEFVDEKTAHSITQQMVLA